MCAAAFKEGCEDQGLSPECDIIFQEGQKGYWEVQGSGYTVEVYLECHQGVGNGHGDQICRGEIRDCDRACNVEEWRGCYEGLGDDACSKGFGGAIERNIGLDCCVGIGADITCQADSDQCNSIGFARMEYKFDFS